MRGVPDNVSPNLPAAFSPDVRGRYKVEPSWPSGGLMVTRPTSDRRYDVQQFTGAPVSTVPAGRWSRGSIARVGAPQFRLPRERWMYDPTMPVQWDVQNT